MLGIAQPLAIGLCLMPGFDTHHPEPVRARGAACVCFTVESQQRAPVLVQHAGDVMGEAAVTVADIQCLNFPVR
ncbi:hypothetical protein SDC9_182411 [bioreactor metagenome]|uniref:Uncharacterized protein n=1 Tax=bioreactor metagenome TaxID=1076179 RepID=A0A645H7A0_9ZZZZ